jgi:hypothetical protein
MNLKITFFFAIVIASLYTFSGVMHVSFGNLDILEHAKVSEGVRNGGQVPPHFLYHFLLNTISSLSGTSSIYASFLAIFIIVLMTFIVAARNIGDAVTGISKYIVILSACFLLLSHPIPIVFPYDQHIYHGYVASNVYHNPTILLLKLFSLIHFSLLCKVLESEDGDKTNYLDLILLAILTALTIIAKPNYIIILIPALFILYFGLRFFVNKSTRGIFAVGASIGAPALILLIWQFVYFYGSESKNSIGIGLFEVFAASSELWTLLPKLIASFAFPVAVLVVLGSKLTRRFDFQLSALMLAVSLFYAYCLVDSVAGTGQASGNFWWSAQIAHFLLLFVCIKAYLGFAFSVKYDCLDRKTVTPLLPLYVGGIQLLSGMLWYVVNATPGIMISGW